jgi:hypothetical protein
MSIETFMSEYERETKPLRVAHIYSLLAKGHRLAPGGKVELKLNPHSDGVAIHWIGSRESGKGQGTAALTWLCDLADRHDVTLTLKVKGGTMSDGVLRLINRMENQRLFSPKDLRAWYRSHGFKAVRRERVETTVRKSEKKYEDFTYYDVYMSRAPRCKKKRGQRRAPIKSRF